MTHSPSWSFRVLAAACLLCLSALAWLPAEDEVVWPPAKPASEPPAGTTPAPAPAPAPGVAAPAAPAPAAAVNTRAITNERFLAAVRDYSGGKGLAIVEQGDGPVRLMLVGGAKLDGSAAGLALAKKAIDGLEVWAGSQETFIATKPPAGEIYWLVVFASADQVGGWIDYLREKNIVGKPEGEDLTKKVLAFPGQRTYFTHAQKVQPLVDAWMVYSASCMAVDAFYLAHGDKTRAPTWIREGLGSELQRALCQKILCTTIAYEDKSMPMSDSWATDVAQLFKSNNRQAKPGTELMRMGLESLPNVFYQQMWSLCAFVRASCGNKKGAENKFRKLLDLTAAGTSSEDAVKQLFGKSDPLLTNAWHTWALQQK